MYLTTRGRLGEPNKVLRRAVIDFDRVKNLTTAASPSGGPAPSTWPRPGSPRCASIRRRTATTRCLYAKCSGGTATSYMIYQQQHNVEGARGGRAATPAPTYCGTTTARSARSTSRRGRRRAATTRRRTNWSCGTSTTSTLLRRRRRGNFLEVRRPKPVLRHFDRSIETRSGARFQRLLRKASGRKTLASWGSDFTAAYRATRPLNHHSVHRRSTSTATLWTAVLKLSCTAARA